MKQKALENIMVFIIINNIYIIYIPFQIYHNQYILEGTLVANSTGLDIALKMYDQQMYCILFWEQSNQSWLHYE